MYKLTDKTVNEKVDISIKDAPLSQVLDILLSERKLKWSIRENTVRVEDASEPTATLKMWTSSPHLYFSPPITGIVRGADGKPIAGVNVVIKNTNKGVVTDAYGQFSIEAESGNLLVISSVGYNSQEVKVARDKSSIIVSLTINTSPLDEVQIIAYGTTSQRLNTGNVGILKGEEITKQPVSNPLGAMVGRIPGVFITQNTGVAGGGFNIQIRGKNSSS